MASSINKGSVEFNIRGSARDVLLETASTLMRERDTLDISLSEIAARANLNSALVKYYFGHKTGLMLALLERDLKTAIPQLEGLLEMDMPPTRKMRLHISGLVRLYFQYPYLQRLMMAIMRDNSDEVAQGIADRFLKPINVAYEHLISEGVASGEFKPTDPRLFYFTLIGACDQIFSAKFVLRFVHGIDTIDEELRRTYADHIAQLLIEGLKV